MCIIYLIRGRVHIHEHEDGTSLLDYVYVITYLISEMNI